MVLPAFVLVKQHTGHQFQEPSISLEIGAQFPQHCVCQGRGQEPARLPPPHFTALVSHLPMLLSHLFQVHMQTIIQDNICVQCV